MRGSCGRFQRICPVLTLAIDCSARSCSAALFCEGADRILAEASPDIGRGHAEKLPAILQSVLDAAGTDLDGIGRIGVTVGPGSFAGIRVGVAFARGLALALGVRAVGVGCLEAIAGPAARAGNASVMAVLDARRDHVWMLLADPRGVVIEPAAEMSPLAAARLAADSGCLIAGSGAHLLAELDPSLAARITGDPAAPAIADVARMAARLDPQSNPAEPRYLRDADAKPQAGYALPHKD